MSSSSFSSLWHGGSILASHPAARVQFLVFPRIDFDVAEIYPWCLLELSGQKLDNIDWTYLVLAIKYYKKGFLASARVPLLATTVTTKLNLADLEATGGLHIARISVFSVLLECVRAKPERKPAPEVSPAQSSCLVTSRVSHILLKLVTVGNCRYFCECHFYSLFQNLRWVFW